MSEYDPRLPYLQSDHINRETPRIDFVNYIESVRSRTEQTKSTRETYPGYHGHPLEDIDPLTYEHLRDFYRYQLAQNLFRSAIRAIDFNRKGIEKLQANLEEYSADQLLFFRSYPDIIQDATALAQRGNDEDWPFIAVETGFSLLAKYEDLPPNSDITQPIEVQTAIPYFSIVNHQKNRPESIRNPLDHPWCIKTDYDILFDHMRDVLRPLPSAALDAEKHEELVDTFVGFAGMKQSGWDTGVMEGFWARAAAMQLLPYRKNQKQLEELAARAREKNPGAGPDFTRNVLHMIRPQRHYGLSQEEKEHLKTQIRTGTTSIAIRCASPGARAQLEGFVGVQIAPYIDDVDFLRNLAQEISEDEEYYMQ